MFSYNVSKFVVNLSTAVIPSKTIRRTFRNYLLKKLHVNYKKQCYVMSYLQKYILTDGMKISYDNVDSHDLPIWQLWLQGEANAPILVKNCFDSVNKFSNERKIIRLTNETIEDYIKLPDFIIEKYKKGIISISV